MFSVVAPCFSPPSHVCSPKCKAHQIPTNFNGFIHETSSILQASFKLSIKLDSKSSAGELAIITQRQGVENGVLILAHTESGSGQSPTKKSGEF
ncbi:MAG: hypothetical protein BWX59_02343 [Bacteroidetes bacterium ADurb.Bin028]|nr:MAG: hypothetical protein BWX59_02343 [Bacteroidetes bacterium ADurb.Bin028]